MASTRVTYKGFDLTFGGSQAAPFVSLDNDYIQVGGETWVKLQVVTLNGILEACGKSALWGLTQSVKNGFNEDFGSLSADGFEVECAKVRSIDFEDSPMLSYIRYSITLEAYDHDTFRESFKVINPSERVEFNEGDNQTLTKTISVSAKGVTCGGNDALANAKSFVMAKFGEHEGSTPGLISSKDSNYGNHLVSSSEEIDRITGTYTKTKTYLSDLSSKDGSLVLRYTKEIFDERGEYRRVKFNGSLRYGIQNQAASSGGHAKIKQFVGANKINGYRLYNLNIDEDKFAGVINFNFEYTEDNVDVVDDWDVTVSEDSSSSLVRTTISGVVTAKGPKECRWDKVNRYFGSNEKAKARYYSIVTPYYNEFGPVKKTAGGEQVLLNQKPIDFQITKDEKNGEISYTFNFDNRISFGFYTFDYSMTFEPSLWKISANPTVDGEWSLIDLGFRGRARFNINGNAVGSGGDEMKLSDFSKERYKKYCTDSNVKEWLENEQETVSKGADQDVGLAFAYEWSFLPGQAVTAGPQGDEYVTPIEKGLRMK